MALPAQQHVGPLHVVDHAEPLRRPFVQRHLGLDALGDLGHALGVEPGDDLVVVDQQRRALVTEAGAGAEVDADAAVGAHLAAPHAQAPAQIRQQFGIAEHAVGDVVAEQDAQGTHRPGVEETVEADHALDLRQRQPELARDEHQHGARQPAELLLRLAQDLHQRVRVTAVARQQRVDGLGAGGGCSRCRTGNQGHGDQLPRRKNRRRLQGILRDRAAPDPVLHQGGRCPGATPCRPCS